MLLPMVFAMAICVCGDLISAQSYEDFAPCSTNEGKRGVCIPIRKCPSAMQRFQYRRHPETCWFDRRGPVICCQTSDSIMTSPRGWKSKEQCGKYYKSKVESRSWFWGAAHGLIGGFRTSAKEFPHMAVLGFGEESDIKWACGGSLISEKFVLTAAHCLNSRTLGEVKYVRLGDLNLNTTDDDAQPQEFKVLRRIHHPDFKPPSQYNDIALVELEEPAEINDYVKPACLQTEEEIEDPVWIATGWGSTEIGQESVDHLQKVHINEYNFEACRRMYGSSGRRLRSGLMVDSHICAGDETKDTCQGDSGGPLQIRNVGYTSGYTIIGITSFGSGACGVLNAPGVYTRVSKYVDWIESIAWPN